jgi:GTP-binding protein Era
MTRCGHIALLGAPNAGKSTLLNRLVGSKLSIVSPKVQTTRARLLGIAIRGEAQLIFVDTPGIFVPKRRLERAMVAAAWAGAKDADLAVLLIDASHGLDVDTRRILDGMQAAGKRAVIALNQIDKVKREVLLPLAERVGRESVCERVFMISGLTGDGVDDLLDYLVKAVPEGPWLFPAEEITDAPLRLLASEATREQIFLQLQQELPYAATVETESWEEFADGSVKIGQLIHVVRDSQKAIVLGKGGQQIKRIGAAARAELEKFLDRRVHLFLRVVVSEGWSEDRERYAAMRLDFEP